MSIKTTLKASVAAAALVAVAAPVVSSPAEAGLANGNDNGVVISGAINRSLMYTDNGRANDWTNIDGGTDNSRIRILVSGKLTESISVGGVWEANLPAENSTAVTNAGTDIGATVDSGNSAFGLRKTELNFTHATMGKLSFGDHDTSSNNQPSLGSVGGNTNDGMNMGSSLGVYDRTADTNGALASTHFDDYFGGGESRIRYSTPSIAGLVASASLANDSVWDVGVTYGATYGDVQVAAAAQFKNMATDAAASGNANYGAGLALKHSSGISVGGFYGAEAGTSTAANGIDGSTWGMEAGYTTTAMSNLGSTSFEINYSEHTEASVDNFDADVLNFAVQQKMPAGVDVYLHYQIATFDDANAATDLEDITAFMMGTRLSF
jgi:hypothetical protein